MLTVAVRGDSATSWSRRYKANLGRLAGGDDSEIAEVIDQLRALDRDQGLSPGERRMLWRALALLTNPEDGG